MGFFKAIFHKARPGETIHIVSGLPRSGTSMMMKMLESGGIPPYVDNIRAPDVDNPKGYYEFEGVKALNKDNSWVGQVKGKVLKVISMLITYLPPEYEYRVLFMQRDMDEILSSQTSMLKRRGGGSTISDSEMSSLYKKHLESTKAWMNEQPNMEVLYVNYNLMLKEPHDIIREVNRFLGNSLNEEKMARIVDPSLYRQRKQ